MVTENFICNGSVAGNLEVSDSAVGAPFRIGSTVTVPCLLNTQVGGHLRIEANNDVVELRGNFVGKHLQASSNTGGLQIFNNTIQGQLTARFSNPRRQSSADC